MATRTIETKFYLFNQNNSGGYWKIDNKVTKYVIVEAINPDHANNIAEGIGIYFNGVSRGQDCECCGSRWSTVSEYDASDEPEIYGKPVGKDPYTWSTKDEGKAFCRVFYLDGVVKEHFDGKDID